MYKIIGTFLLLLYCHTPVICQVGEEAKPKLIQMADRQMLENINLRRQLAIKELENVGFVQRELIRQICDGVGIPLASCQIDTKAWTVSDTAPAAQNGAPKAEVKAEVEADEENSDK